MYGKRKAIAKRTPLFSSSGSALGSTVGTASASPSTIPPTTPTRLVYQDQEEHEQYHELRDVLSTPAATEGETATETETEPETEMDDQIQTQPQPQVLMNHDILPGRHSTQRKMQVPPAPKISSKSRHQPQSSIASLASVSSDAGVDNGARKKRGMSQHDLLNKYFRRDAVVLRNVDLLRYVY
jgi:phosphatidylethanolamine N-methyltransferase